MRICIPIDEDKGLASPICSHFGSAPAFLLVDTEDESCRALPNRNHHHSHGMCMPLASLQGEELDAVVVSGIGGGALNKLNAAGIGVYLSNRSNVAETLAAFKEGMLEEVTPGTACSHHGHGHA